MDVVAIQKQIADLIKQINWLRQNPKVTPEQLQQVVKTLQEAEAHLR